MSLSDGTLAIFNQSININRYNLRSILFINFQKKKTFLMAIAEMLFTSNNRSALTECCDATMQWPIKNNIQNSRHSYEN